jgi:hypothetical protein
MRIKDVEGWKRALLLVAQRRYPKVVWVIGELDDQKDSHYFRASHPSSAFHLLVTPCLEVRGTQTCIRYFYSSRWLARHTVGAAVEVVMRSLCGSVGRRFVEEA